MAMKQSSFIFFCVSQFLLVYSLPYFEHHRNFNDEYLHAMPYSRKELVEVRKRLNLSMTPDPDEYLTVVSTCMFKT